MNSVRMIVLGAVLGIASQAAFAFQETNSGGQSAAATQAPAAKALDLGIPGASRAAGPEIKLPGLGTIGALPKLDFGLELLYGASTPQNGSRDDKSETGAQIRGTLKYRFPN
jgi:hypothetical protein